MIAPADDWLLSKMMVMIGRTHQFAPIHKRTLPTQRRDETVHHHHDHTDEKGGLPVEITRKNNKGKNKYFGR